MSTVFTFILTLALMVQSQGSLQQKYGPPMRESYLVRPGILVTAMYNKDREVCEMLIEPEPPPSLIKSSDAKLESRVLNEIIDELAPKSERGKHIGSSFLNLTCLPRNDCAGTSETYERVVIYRNGGVNAHQYATIQWKRLGCGN